MVVVPVDVAAASPNSDNTNEQSDGPKRWIGRFLMVTFLATARSSVSLLLKGKSFMVLRVCERRNLLPMCAAGIAMTLAWGCQLLSKNLPATPRPTEAQSRLMDEILKSGGRFNVDADGDPSKINTVYIQKDSLDRIKFTSLAALPELKAVMIIETLGGHEKQHTGFRVESPDDLLRQEYSFRDANWVK
jgi:hypothetical protein